MVILELVMVNADSKIVFGINLIARQYY